MEWRQKRREVVSNWVGIVLEDLKGTRKEIDGYGIGDHFFAKSIENLETLKGGQSEPQEEAYGTRVEDLETA